MDTLTEEQRIEKLNGVFDTQNRSGNISSRIVTWIGLSLRIKFQVNSQTISASYYVQCKGEYRTEENCYMDGTSTDSDISVTFYCSPQIYSRSITIPVQVLPTLNMILQK